MTTPSDPGENLTSSPFDAVAFAYDETFGGWPAARFFRFRLIDSISRRVKHGSRLLDIGSGSGEDAVWLASLGYQVLGIDPSSGMVEVARAKAARAHVGAEFRPQAFETFISDESFDAVYSDFGAMNCVPLEAWVGPLSRLVRPGGSVFFVLMGQKPAPEFLLTGRTAWRRRLAAVAPVDAGRSIRVNYPDPGAIENALGPMFQVERTETFGLLVPPPGTANWPRRNPIAFGLLAALEAVVSNRRQLCRFSDHYLIELTRR